MKYWLGRKEAAVYMTSIGYPIAPQTLANMVTRKDGPPFTRIHWHLVQYRREDLDAWVRQRLQEIAA